MYIPQEVYKLMELDSEFKSFFEKSIEEVKAQAAVKSQKKKFTQSNDLQKCRNKNYRTPKVMISGSILEENKAHTENNKVVFIPSGVTEIADYAFNGSKNRLIVFPKEGLRKIGVHAFTSCWAEYDVKDEDLCFCTGDTKSPFEQLSKGIVFLPESIEEISEWAFSHCEMRDMPLILHENLKQIGACAFFACMMSALYFNGPKEIPKQCFYVCGAMKKLFIDDCVEVIGELAFSCCNELRQIRFSKNLKRIDRYAFQGCGNLRTMSLPYSLESIGEQAFDDCEWLLEVDLPDSVVELGDAVFSRCSRLNKAKLPGHISVIPKELFRDCVKLSDVVITAGVTTIEAEVFKNCKKLVSVVISETVSSIDKSCFVGCNIKSLVIYGVRGSYAEQFAKEHNIKFDDVNNKVVVPKICEACGTKLKKGSKFCHECGAKVVAKPFVSIE